jgi:MFS family permease
LSNWALFVRRFGGVSSVSFLTYLGEFMSLIVVLAFLSDKLTVTYGLGAFGYGIIGPISGSYLVLSGLVAIPVGHLCDKYGRRKFTILGSLLTAVALFSLVAIDQISGLVPFVVGVGVALALMGTGHGIYTASTLAYTGDVATHEDLGKPYGLVEMTELAAFSFGPTLGALIAFEYGRGPTFILSGLLLLAAAAIAGVFMPEPTVGNEEGGKPAQGAVTWKDFFSVLKDNVLEATVLTTFVASLAFSAFFFYVPLYAYSLRGQIPQLAYLYPIFASVMAAIGSFGMIPIGGIEDRTRRRMPILVAGLILGSLSLLVVFFSTTLTALAFASIAFGVSLAIGRVSQLVLLAEHSNRQSRAAVMGTNHAFEHAGYGVGSVFAGIFVASLGLAAAFQILSAVLLVAGLGFLAFAWFRKIE